MCQLLVGRTQGDFSLSAELKPTPLEWVSNLKTNLPSGFSNPASLPTGAPLYRQGEDPSIVKKTSLGTVTEQETEHTGNRAHLSGLPCTSSARNMVTYN